MVNPNPVRPQQKTGLFDSQMEASARDIPERRLLWAVLHRAIWDALGLNIGNPEDRRPVLREVKAWFRVRSKEPFSFLWICEELAVNPARIRKLISGHARVKRALKQPEASKNSSWYVVEYCEEFQSAPPIL